MALGLSFLSSLFHDLLRVWSNKKRDETSTPTAVGPLIMKYSIGVSVYVPYDATEPSHQTRNHEKFLDGVTRVVGTVWDLVISKGAVLEGEAIAASFYIYSLDAPLKRILKKRRVILFFHHSIPVGEKFIYNLEGQLDPELKKACTIKANMSGLAEDLNPIDGPAGQYFKVHFEVVIKGNSGNSKVEAFLRWKEKGVTKCGAATVVPVAFAPDCQVGKGHM